MSTATHTISASGARTQINWVKVMSLGCFLIIMLQMHKKQQFSSASTDSMFISFQTSNTERVSRMSAVVYQQHVSTPIDYLMPLKFQIVVSIKITDKITNG